MYGSKQWRCAPTPQTFNESIKWRIERREVQLHLDICRYRTSYSANAFIEIWNVQRCWRCCYGVFECWISGYVLKTLFSSVRIEYLKTMSKKWCLFIEKFDTLLRKYSAKFLYISCSSFSFLRIMVRLLIFSVCVVKSKKKMVTDHFFAYSLTEMPVTEHAIRSMSIEKRTHAQALAHWHITSTTVYSNYCENCDIHHRQICLHSGQKTTQRNMAADVMM